MFLSERRCGLRFRSRAREAHRAAETMAKTQERERAAAPLAVRFDAGKIRKGRSIRRTTLKALSDKAPFHSENRLSALQLRCRTHEPIAAPTGPAQSTLGEMAAPEGERYAPSFAGTAPLPCCLSLAPARPDRHSTCLRWSECCSGWVC